MQGESEGGSANTLYQAKVGKKTAGQFRPSLAEFVPPLAGAQFGVSAVVPPAAGPPGLQLRALPWTAASTAGRPIPAESRWATGSPSASRLCLAAACRLAIAGVAGSDGALPGHAGSVGDVWFGQAVDAGGVAVGLSCAAGQAAAAGGGRALVHLAAVGRDVVAVVEP